MPVNFLILRALKQYYLYYGDTFEIVCPTGSGKMKTLDLVAEELGRRLARIFLLGAEGGRAIFGDCKLFNNDPLWRD